MEVGPMRRNRARKSSGGKGSRAADRPGGGRRATGSPKAAGGRPELVVTPKAASRAPAKRRGKVRPTPKATVRAKPTPPPATAVLAITDRGRPRSNRPFLQRVVRAALEHGGAPAMPVSLLLTDDTEIAQVHADFLGDATATDVISFAIDGEAELVVSVETAARNAEAHGHALAAEVALYVVHGLLHLCGYDDRTARARARMRRAERAVLAALGLVVADVDG